MSWPRLDDLFDEAKGFVCVIMHKVIMTNNYWECILKDGTVDNCRAVTVLANSHKISVCSPLANGEYLLRHNQVAMIVY